MYHIPNRKNNYWFIHEHYTSVRNFSGDVEYESNNKLSLSLGASSLDRGQQTFSAKG